MAFGLHRPSFDLKKALNFGFWGAGGGIVGALASEFVEGGGGPGPFVEVIVHTGLWFAIIGGLITVALLLGQERYGGRSLEINGTAIRRIVLGTAFGAMSGFISGALAEVFYGSIGPTETLRVICWGIAGGLLGFAISFRIPNLSSMRGFAGGFSGGIGGGIVFIAFASVMGELLGRLFGIAAIGFAIGLMITLADALFRKAWIEVRYGPKEARTLTLGAEPLRIGSARNECNVYVKDVLSIACVYRFEGGQVFCEDRVKGTSGPVAFGVANSVGNVAITPWGASGRGQESQTIIPVAASRPMQANTIRHVLSLTGGRRFTLVEGTRLSANDLPGLDAAGGDGSVAEVCRDPNDTTILGLKNLSRREWSAGLSSGGSVHIHPGRTLQLQAGTRIDFGAAAGEIQ